MLPGTVKDPALTVNGATMVFPAEVTSGNWLECNGPEDCILYGAKGEILSKVAPGRLPAFRAGRNEVQFSCAPPAKLRP